MNYKENLIKEIERLSKELEDLDIRGDYEDFLTRKINYGRAELKGYETAQKEFSEKLDIKINKLIIDIEDASEDLCLSWKAHLQLMRDEIKELKGEK